MTHTQLFDKLGAPLANKRWSWGSVRENDGTVFLLVWQDRVRKIDDIQKVRISHHVAYAEDNPENLGYQERLRHIALLQSGSPCYLVLCIAKNVNDRPRSVADFLRDEVFRAGAVKEHEGETWIELGQRVSVRRAAQLRET